MRGQEKNSSKRTSGTGTKEAHKNDAAMVWLMAVELLKKAKMS